MIFALLFGTFAHAATLLIGSAPGGADFYETNIVSVSTIQHVNEPGLWIRGSKSNCLITSTVAAARGFSLGDLAILVSTKSNGKVQIVCYGVGADSAAQAFGVLYEHSDFKSN